MKQLLGWVVVLGIIGGVLYWRGQQKTDKLNLPPVGDNLQANQLAESLPASPVPTETPKVVYKTNDGSVQVYTRQEGEVTFYQLTAQLPRLEQGFYSAWIENEKRGDLLNLGTFRDEKGGLMLEFQTKGNVSGYDTFMVTQELRDDAKPEQVLIRGKLPEGR